MANQEQQLNRLNLFETVVIGIYGNWLISLVDKIGFDKAVWILGTWYQPLCIITSFSTLLLLFAFSVFRPIFMTRRWGFLLGVGHVSGNYGALWAEGLGIFTNRLFFFYWIGTILFLVIYVIELRRTRIGRH